MAAELTRLASVMPVAAALATATALREGRRRAALNEALHELRRPLQALALAEGGDESGLGESLRMASDALERLDREINGGAAGVSASLFPARPLLEAAVRRWRRRAQLAGGSLRLRWRGGEPLLRGDREAIARAVDNLLANAVEHGGRRAEVLAQVRRGRLRVSVLDSGSRPPRGRRAALPRELAAWISGRRRHGHGLRVVRQVAETHGGGFRLLRSPAGTEARLELPLAGGSR